MGGYDCIELSQARATHPCEREAPELCLAGAGGEIWEDGKGGYVAVVQSATHERLVRFQASKLSNWVRKLGVPRDPTYQLVKAEKYSLRFNELGEPDFQGSTNAALGASDTD